MPVAETDPPAKPEPALWGRARRPLLLAIAGMGLAHALFYVYVTSDDAFISLRYAQNLVAGHGLLYNPGEPPVEGFSNPLLTLATALLLSIGLPGLWAIKGIGLTALVVGLWRLPTLVGELDPRSGTLARLGASLLLAASAYFCFSAVTGLETVLHALLVTVATTWAVVESRRGEVRWTPAGWLLVALSRPEGALLAAAVAAVQWILLRFQASVFRAWLFRFALPASVLVVGRYLYYGALLPNTFDAKVGAGASALQRGGSYLWRFASEGGGWLLLPALAGCVLALCARRTRAPGGIVAAVVAAQLLFILVAGGDFMPAARFVVPVYPLLCALAVTALTLTARQLPRGFALALPLAGVALISAASLVSQTRALRVHPLRFWLLHDDARPSLLPGTDLRGTWLEGHQAAGEFVRRRARPGDRLVVSEAGVMPYYAGLRTIDLFGLTDPEIATRLRGLRLASRADRTDRLLTTRRAVTQHVFAARPRWIVLDGHFDADSGAFVPRLALGRWLLTHPEWRHYSPVFRSEVYTAAATGLAADRHNVVFERAPVR